MIQYPSPAQTLSKGKRRRPPALNDIMQRGYLKNGDKIVYAIGKTHFIVGKVLFRKKHKATIRVKNKHLKKLVDNKQHVLKQILSAIVKHPGDDSVEEVLEMDYFTTPMTTFVQLGHQLQQHKTSNSPSNQRKRKTASQPYKDPNLFVMPCASVPGRNDLLIPMGEFRDLCDKNATGKQDDGGRRPNVDEDLVDPHIRATYYGGERNAKALEGTFQLTVESRSRSSGNAVASTDEEDEQHRRAHNSETKGPTSFVGDNGPYRAYKSKTGDDPRAMEDDLIFKDDLILKLNFDTTAAKKLCRGFEQFHEAKQGMQEGMLLYIPRKLAAKVLEEDGEGCLAEFGDTGGRKFSFQEDFLQECQQKNRGIAHMICNPSGGGKSEHAYLDYSEMIMEDTPHLRCVFVKEREVRAYRMRYRELLLVQLPHGSNNLFVGDARFWILAFVTQLRLHAEKRKNGECATSFFSRCYMLDDDITVFHKIDHDKEPPNHTAVPLEDVLREQPPHDETGRPPPKTPETGLIGYSCRRQYNPAKSEWVGVDTLGTPVASVLNVSTHVEVQFHMYAELAEDVDFDQRLRLRWWARRNPENDVKKCNKYCYTRASSGNDVGAVRKPDESNDAFVKQVVGACERAFTDRKNTRITQTGTYPLLRANHPWTFQSVSKHLRDYTFNYIRSGGLRRTKIKQGLFVWLLPELPMSEPLPGESAKDALRKFFPKLSGPAVLVLPEDTVLPDCGRVQQKVATESFRLPWRNTTKKYKIIISLPAPPPSEVAQASQSPGASWLPQPEAPSSPPQTPTQPHVASSARPGSSMQQQPQSPTESQVASSTPDGASNADDFWNELISVHTSQTKANFYERQQKGKEQKKEAQAQLITEEIISNHTSQKKANFQERQQKEKEHKKAEARRVKEEKAKEEKAKDFEKSGGKILAQSLREFVDIEKRISNQKNISQEDVFAFRGSQGKLCMALQRDERIKLLKLAAHDETLREMYAFLEIICKLKADHPCVKQFTDFLFQDDDSLPKIFNGFIDRLGKAQELQKLLKLGIDNFAWGPSRKAPCWHKIKQRLQQSGSSTSLPSTREAKDSVSVASPSCQLTRVGEQRATDDAGLRMNEIRPRSHQSKKPRRPALQAKNRV